MAVRRQDIPSSAPSTSFHEDAFALDPRRQLELLQRDMNELQGKPTVQQILDTLLGKASNPNDETDNINNKAPDVGIDPRRIDYDQIRKSNTPYHNRRGNMDVYEPDEDDDDDEGAPGS